MSKSDIEISVGLQVETLNNQLKELGRKLKDPKNLPLDVVSRQVIQTHNKIKSLFRSLESYKPPFAGWAMSIMFFGMALQRAFDTIWKSSSKTFNDVIHSVDGAITKFDTLNSSIAYLQFVTGDALEPLAELIIPIIDELSEWITNNEGVVRSIVGTTGIIGTLTALGGALVLARNGINEFLISIGVLKRELSTLDAVKVGVALFLAFDAYEQLKKGEVYAGAARALESAGFMFLLSGKNKVGGAAIGIGIALQVVDVLSKNGGKLTPEALADLLMQAGGLLLFVNPAVGGAMLTIGVVLTLIDEELRDKFILFLGILGGIIMQIGAAVLDTILLPIRAFINSVLSIYNWITHSHIRLLRYTPISSAAYHRLLELIDQFKNYDSYKIRDPTIPRRRTMNASQAREYYSQPQGTTNIYNFYGYTGDDVIRAVRSHY